MSAFVEETRQKPNLAVDPNAVDTGDRQYQRGRIHVLARSRMPEKQLFDFAEYRAQEAERTGYSDYSYWKSVWHNFLKKKADLMENVYSFLCRKDNINMRSDKYKKKQAVSIMPLWQAV